MVTLRGNDQSLEQDYCSHLLVIKLRRSGQLFRGSRELASVIADPVLGGQSRAN
jgi:hypothetical protein